MTRLIPLVALVLFTPLLAAPVPKGVKKDLMPTAVGTRWEYVREGEEKPVSIEEVTESATEDGVTTFTLVRKRSDDDRLAFVYQYRIQDGVLWETANEIQKFCPPIQVWDPGMKTGESWESGWSTREFRFAWTSTVGKPAEVKTPAGTFTATPITQRETADGPETVYWYAVAVGLVKQTRDGKVEQELKSFTPGKGAKK